MQLNYYIVAFKNPRMKLPWSVKDNSSMLLL